MLKLSSALAVTALAVALPAQFTLVAPNGYATAEGGSNNVFPWGRTTAPMHFLQIYDSTHFTAQGVVSPVLISRMRFRANAVAATTSWTGGTYPNAVISMSTAAVDYTAANATFASNHGTDLRVVANSATILPGSGNGTTTPGPWYTDVVISPPFLYDPTSNADLAFEVVLDTTGWTGTSTATDAISGATATPAPPLGTRVYNTTSATATTGTVGLHHMLATEFTYVPAAGLFASFSATPRTGSSPLQVQFTDQSFSSDPGGVIAWTWDVDGDTVIDYTVRNPVHTYACGTYNVSLTAYDAAHAPNTLTRNGFIVTDVVQPSFTASLLGPLGTMQFTDTSVPAASAWAWDLNGDNVIDSTAQNPVWVYGSHCVNAPVNVTLTASSCAGSWSVTRAVRPANSIETIRDGNTSTSTGAGNYIDVNVTHPAGISVCMMEMKTTAAANQPMTFNVYITPTTWVGKHNVMSAWRQIATGTTTSAPNATDLEFVIFNAPFYLPPGSWGLHLQPSLGSTQYTSTTGTWSNADLSITTGGAGVLGGSVINGRTWNGAFYYSTCSTGGEAGYTFMGDGCTGSNGMPTNTASALPRLGQTMTANLGSLPFPDAAFFIIGFSKTMSQAGPLPLDLGAFGAPGCPARVSPDSVTLIVGTGGTAAFNLALPNSPALLCQVFHTQGMALDMPLPPATPPNALGVVVSDAATAVIGQ